MKTVGMTYREIEAARLKHERLAKTLFKKALVEQQKAAFEFVKSATSIDQLKNYNPVFKDDSIKSAMINVYQQCGSETAAQTYGKIEQQQSKSDMQALYLQWMKNYAENQTGNRITLISGTTEDRFKQIVKEQVLIGENEGYSIDKIAANIQKQLNISNAYRAVRIARTETVSASNAGSLAGAKASNLPLKKVWLATKTGNTRHSHEDMNGVSVEMAENFNVPIYEGNNLLGHEPMQHPGDPSGSAGNVINCRCTIVYERKI